MEKEQQKKVEVKQEPVEESFKGGVVSYGVSGDKQVQLTRIIEHKNEIRINFSTAELHVASNTSNLQEVFVVANTIALALGRGTIDGKTAEQRIRDVGVQ